MTQIDSLDEMNVGLFNCDINQFLENFIGRETFILFYLDILLIEKLYKLRNLYNVNNQLTPYSLVDMPQTF